MLCHLRTVPDAYYVINDLNERVPEGYKVKKSFYRIPSNYFNSDFYTYQDALFENEPKIPFFELHKKN